MLDEFAERALFLCVLRGVRFNGLNDKGPGGFSRC